MSTDLTATVGSPMPPVELQSADGSPVTLADFAGDGPLLVMALRYYGCLPCLAETRRELEAAVEPLWVPG